MNRTITSPSTDTPVRPVRPDRSTPQARPPRGAGDKPRLRASLVASHMRGNKPFMPGAGPNGGEFFLPWRQLRARLLTEGIELNTPDLNVGWPVAFELHLNAQRKLPVGIPSYAYLYEDPIIRPLNARRDRLAEYRKVFTSNEELIDGDHILRLDYPNDLSVKADMPGWDARDQFCVMIASNKALLHPHPRNLHAQRVAVIRFFEAQAPELFSLYGPGWDKPAVQPGSWGRIIKRLNEWRARLRPPKQRPFPSYRGIYPGPKRELLERARFAICYENSRGSPGYLTEKIFDCLASGCVPVYIGTTHSQAPIPAACYIDGDRFADHHEMLAFLRSVTPAQFVRYQQAQMAFLHSPEARRFGNRHFCEVLTTRILADQALLARESAPQQSHQPISRNSPA